MLALLLVAVAFLAGAFFVAVLAPAAFFAGAFFVAVLVVVAFFAAGAFLVAAGLASPDLVGAASFTGPDVPVGGGEVSIAYTERTRDGVKQVEVSMSMHCRIKA